MISYSGIIFDGFATKPRVQNRVLACVLASDGGSRSYYTSAFFKRCKPGAPCHSHNLLDYLNNIILYNIERKLTIESTAISTASLSASCSSLRAYMTWCAVDCVLGI